MEKPNFAQLHGGGQHFTGNICDLSTAANSYPQFALNDYYEEGTITTGGNIFENNIIVGGNSGTIVGNVTYGSGEVEQAFSFNANGAGVVVGNPVSLQLQNFTIDTWIRRGSTTQATYAPSGGGDLPSRRKRLPTADVSSWIFEVTQWMRSR